ncbi:hypothetical protein LQW54_012922 [Pestalotiopsis sp. IQ-011]
MRSLLLIACAAGSTSAAWLRWTDRSTPTWKPPQETGISEIADVTSGWTPKPTQAPGHRSEGEVVLDLLRRDATTDWTNSATCGWVSGTSSYPWTCDKDFVCATNDANAVACASGDYQPFFVSCLDRSAYQEGFCDDSGPETGCCSEAAAPACVTYLWTGLPHRSQLRCGTATAITTMLDEPQFVIDASISASKASEASKSSAAEASESATQASLSTSTSTLSDGTVVVVTSTVDPLTSTTGASTSTSSNSTNVGAIVGGVVGGLAFLLLLLLLCCCRRRRKSKKTNYNMSYKRSNNEKTTVYNSRRDKRQNERRHREAKPSRSRSHKSRAPPKQEVVSDDDSYDLGFAEGLRGQRPTAPRQAHVVDDDRPVYAPQYHFHVSSNGKRSREGSIIETTPQYHAM